MLLVDAIDLGLHFGMPALDQDGEFTDQPVGGRRVTPVKEALTALVDVLAKLPGEEILFDWRVPAPKNKA